MRLMHTRLPDFYQKVIDAGKKLRPETEVTITGLENMQTAKLASLRVGRVEEEVLELTEQNPRIKKVEVVILPRVPETIHTVIIKGIEEDGSCPKAIMESMFCTMPGEEVALENVGTVEDRRIAID